MESYNRDDIIFALATPWAQSALAVIRVSGEGARALIAPSFSRPTALLKAKNATLVHGYLTDGPKGDVLDEVVVAVYTDGHGYTGEEALEFSCHGSLPGLQRILASFSRLGMRPAEGGEFTFRAFLHGRMDLTQAEAVQELITSQSERSQALALARLEGGLRKEIQHYKESLLTLLAHVEVQLDYAEDEVDDFTFPRQELIELKEGIAQLASTYAVGRLYGQGARIVLAGATNVGKSTLFNLLLKEERSIVSDIRGTTRDYIEADCLIEGIPVRLYDTAGLRESKDSIESAGIEKAERLIGKADLVIFLVDSSEVGHIPKKDDRTLIVYSKSDLFQAPAGELAISAKSGQGITELLAALAQRLRAGTKASGDEQVVIESERQHQKLHEASLALERAVTLVDDDIPLDIVAVEIGEALQNLGELTGEVTPADILTKIFSGFCVGK